jgi:tRNA (adenine22-N1)-methyltransferase
MGQCKHIIAADISAESLFKANLLAEKCGMDDRLELRLGDGLSVIEPGEADALVMAGMGGVLISNILRQGEPVARAAERIVMQPMRGEEDLRYFLFHNGYNITDEALALDAGRIYQLICAKSGEPEQKPAEWPVKLYKLGWVMYKKRDPLLLTQVKRYLEGNRQKLKPVTGSAFSLREQTKCLEDLLILLEGNADENR